jgi:hypothetical protein
LFTGARRPATGNFQEHERMSPNARSQQVYEELAGWYDHQGQAKLRDWFLVLAADAALALGHADKAERLRQRLLHVNPHHLLRPFGSFAEALRSPDVQGYIADLRRNYPLETAEQLLQASRRQASEEPPPVAQPMEERELKVYRGRETPSDPKVPRARTTQSHPETSLPESAIPVSPPAPRMPTPVAWTRPSAAAKPAPPEPPRVVVLDDEGPSGLGYWVSSLLFVLTLLLGLALAAYAFAGPFLRGLVK